MKKTFIIAEIAQAHDGSLGILHSLIDAVAVTGVTAIKFQTHIASAESSVQEQFRVKFSYVDQTRYDYWKRMELAPEQWAEIKKHCEAVNLEFMSSPFSNAAIDLLEALGMNRYKIGSGEVNNLLMLDKIARTGKEIILSSGMSSFVELDETIDFLKQYGNQVAVMQCTTIYPTPAPAVGLNVITELKKRYQLPVGLSDHSGTIFPSLAAIVLGAEIIEVHVTFDKRMFGPDAPASLTINELQELVNGIEFIETSLNHLIDKNDVSQFQQLKEMFGKSLAVNRDLPEGQSISFEDMEGKKPAGAGIPAREYATVIGRRLKVAKRKNEFLQSEDLA